MLQTAACPDVSRLREWLMGGLDDVDAASLEQHLTDCSACLSVLRQHEATDTLIDRLGVAASTLIEVSVDAAVLRELKWKIKGLRSNQETLAPSGPASEALAEITRMLAPAQQSDELGRLAGYRILRILGAGGMGVVLLAEDIQLKRLTALKVLMPSLAAQSDGRQRFLREAQSSAALKHAHIVTIYQVGEDRGMPFLAMELLEGESLEDRLRREGPLPSSETIRLGLEIAEGLAAAHERGLIHRDIKPANIFLERNHAKILDFGLARSSNSADGVTAAGYIVGSPGYLSPEQVTGAPLDARSDLFSLGCVLYLMATGQRPFQGGTLLECLRALEMHVPVFPHKLRPETPRELSYLIKRLLAKQVSERPTSAKLVARQLRAMSEPRGNSAALPLADLATEPALPMASLHIPPAPPRTRWTNWIPQRRFAVMAAAALLLFLGGVWTTHQMLQGRGDTLAPLPRPGEPVGPVALVRQPEKIPGLRSWTLDAHMFRGLVSTIAYRPDSKLFATAGEDSTIRIWEVASGKLVLALAQQVPVFPYGNESPPTNQMLAWSPNGKLLAVGGDSTGRFRLYDTESGKLRRVISESNSLVTAIAWNGDGTKLVTGHNDGKTCLWNREGELLRTLRQDAKVVTQVALAPDGKRIAVCSDKLRIWNNEGIVEHTYDYTANNLAFAPDGKLLAVTKTYLAFKGNVPWGNAQIPMIIDMETGQEISLEGKETVRFVASGSMRWLDRGKRLLDAGRIWDIAERKVVHQFRTKTNSAFSYFLGQIWAPDGKSYVNGSMTSTLEIFEADSSKRLAKLEGHPSLRHNGTLKSVLSANGKILATLRSNMIDFWDTATGKRIREMPCQAEFIDSFCWSAQGTLLIADSHGRVTLLDPSGRHDDAPIAGLHFAPAPKEPLWAFIDRPEPGRSPEKIRVWHSITNETWDLGKSAGVNALKWSPDGALLAVSRDKGTDIWQWATKKKVRSVPDFSYQVAWSPDSRYFGTNSKTWDWKTGMESSVAVPGRHFYEWSPDAKNYYEFDGPYKLYVCDWETKKVTREMTSELFGYSSGYSTLAGKNAYTLGQAYSVGTNEAPYAAALFLILRGGAPLAIAANGHYRTSGVQESELIYITLAEDGRQETLTPAEFRRRYQWQNDPDKVRPLP